MGYGLWVGCCMLCGVWCVSGACCMGGVGCSALYHECGGLFVVCCMMVIVCSCGV